MEKAYHASGGPLDRPRIRYLNGARLRRALIAGARQLFEHRDGLNAINVFPVADSDTGTNMSGTLGAVVEGIASSRERGVHRMLRRIADLALSGARGCSGTILAQFLHGLAEELRDAARVTARLFGDGILAAVGYSYEALSQPKEGTMLTVLADWGRSVHEWSRRSDDFAEVLSHAYKAAIRSLEETREKLPVLKLAGVVDAGAQGLVHLLAGITSFIANGRIRELDRLAGAMPREELAPDDVGESPLFRYCTQCAVESANTDPKRLREALEGLGDSLIVAGSTSRARVHIHSSTPAKVVQVLERHGRVTDHRVEDMAGQFRAAHTPHRDVALVVDSSCDLPPEVWERHNIHLVPCILRYGDRTYLDKLTMVPEGVYGLLASARRGMHPTTSQPSPGDFRARFEFLLKHYREVVSLSLSGPISGTYDSARTAAKIYGEKVFALDTRSASVGFGLVARRAAEAIEAGATGAQVAALVRRLVARVHVHLTVPSLAGLVRSGRVSPVKGFAANLLHLKPIIKMDSSTGGKPAQGAMVFGVRGGRQRILEILEREIDRSLPVELAVAHADAPDDARWFKERLEERFTLAREIYVVDVTTVLVAHIGLGAVGLAYLEPEPRA